MELIDWPLLALLDHHGPCALKELMSETDGGNIDVGEKSQSLNKEVYSVTLTLQLSLIIVTGSRGSGDNAGTITECW